MISQKINSQSDAIRFLSMGFNTELWNKFYATHYFYGYDDYSEAIIWINSFVSGLQLSMKNNNTFYPIDSRYFNKPPTEYKPYFGRNESIGYLYTHQNGPHAYEIKYKMVVLLIGLAF
jgi:hypothetical protein